MKEKQGTVKERTSKMCKKTSTNALGNPAL